MNVRHGGEPRRSCAGGEVDVDVKEIILLRRENAAAYHTRSVRPSLTPLHTAARDAPIHRLNANRHLDTHLCTSDSSEKISENRLLLLLLLVFIKDSFLYESLGGLIKHSSSCYSNESAKQLFQANIQYLRQLKVSPLGFFYFYFLHSRSITRLIFCYFR